MSSTPPTSSSAAQRRVNPFGAMPDLPQVPPPPLAVSVSRAAANPFAQPSSSTLMGGGGGGPVDDDIDLFAPPPPSPPPASTTTTPASKQGVAPTASVPGRGVAVMTAPPSRHHAGLDTGRDADVASTSASAAVLDDGSQGGDAPLDSRRGHASLTEDVYLPGGALAQSHSTHLGDDAADKVAQAQADASEARSTAARLEAERDLLKQQLRSLEAKVDAAAHGGGGGGRRGGGGVAVVLASPEEAISLAMSTGTERYEQWRSLSDKADLLDAAVVCGRGDVVARVCMFVAKTLSRPVFYKILRDRPAAVQQYAATLRRRKDWEALIDLYAGVHLEPLAALAEFDQAIAESDVKQQVRLLEKCLVRVKRCEEDGGAFKQGLRGLSSRHIAASIALTKTQHSLDATDRGATTAPFQRWPKRRGTVRMPALTTLWYGWLYHYSEPTHSGHPQQLQKTLGDAINEKQLLWTGVRARAKAGDWDAIDTILARKTKFFGSSKLKPAISPAGIANVLLASRAPKPTVKKYAMLIDDPHVRWKILAAAELHLEAVKALIEIKDPTLLESYYTKPEVVGDFHVRQVAFDALESWRASQK
eukprot:m.211641 g.211641  ORF g.211641 m.211641 type:complete len:590 (+) comp25592_c0_seq1:75-1844(+)